MTNEEFKTWYAENQYLFSVTIELTQNCNFFCKHCYCSEKKQRFLSLSDFKKIINKIADTECLSLSFTGGEILSHPNFFEMYTYAKHQGFLINLLTNGALLTQKHIELFKKLPPKLIAITLYGSNQLEYEKFTGNGFNFEKVMNALKMLKEANINFGLRTIATKTFKDSLMQGNFDKIAKKFEVNFYYSPLIFPKINGDTTPMNEALSVNEIIELEKTTKLRKLGWEKNIIENNTQSQYQWKCNAGVSSFSINMHGEAFICTLFRKYPISILQNDIKTVLQHLNKIHENHIKIVYSNECISCRYRKNCKWCPVYANIYNNSETEKIKLFCKLSEERIKFFSTEERR